MSIQEDNPRPPMIELRGLRVNNLKAVDLDLPYGKLIVFCGPSGSGKSSLAIDTVYAEGRRRFIESFSIYERRFLERIEKPEAVRIDGIPPAIAIDLRTLPLKSRLNLAQVTEILDYLEILFVKFGTYYCPKCGKAVIPCNPDRVLEILKTERKDDRVMLGFSPANDDLPEDPLDFRNEYLEYGFVRCFIGGEILRLDEGAIPADKYARSLISPEYGPIILNDRVIPGETGDDRVLESIESAMRFGNGTLKVLGRRPPFEVLSFSRGLRCCNREFPPPSPEIFRNDNPEADSIKIEGNNLGRLLDMKADELRAFLGDVSRNNPGHETLFEPVVSRLSYIEEVGLGHLSLSRSLPSLSTGEFRRIGLTKALGSSLVNLAYVLDEPSLGLHPREAELLLGPIRSLRDRGNTIILIEHSELFIEAADHLVEMGPGSGPEGGNLVFQGTPAQMKNDEKSPTGKYLNFRLEKSGKRKSRRTPGMPIVLEGASGRHLKNVTIEFPGEVLCIVAGPSGSGKSTLVRDTLFPAIESRIRAKDDGPASLPYENICGHERFSEVLWLDQSPIGRSGRSNPASHMKIFDEIRNLYAESPDAEACGFTAGHFSFNLEGGRCDTCKGDGHIGINMQFMADIFVPCPDCRGKRYRSNVLEITYRNRNISEVLDMTAIEAFGFFRGRGKIQQRLKRMLDLGLDYLRLGQPGNTLSGGESQRLKLASHLANTRRRGRCLFLMDEPSSGLYFTDIEKLLDCFASLIEQGHSLIVIENNLQFMAAADHIIELGPGAGESGGRILAVGPPEKIVKNPESPTGRYLVRRFRNLH